MDGTVVYFECRKGDCLKQKEPLIHSGLYLGNWVITQAGPLISHLQQYHSNYVLQSETDSLIHISEYGLVPWVLTPNGGFYEKRQVTASYIWGCEKLASNLEKIMQNSAGVFLNCRNLENLTEKEKANVLAYFVALQLDCDKFYNIKVPKNTLQLGQEVVAVSTPFTCISFHNSITKGSICNIVSDSLVLVDLKLTPGSEGAPVFSFSDGKIDSLIGLVICNIVFQNSELTGYSFVASASVISSHMPQLTNKLLTVSIDSPFCTFLFDEKSVVRITVGLNWGSGIIISEDGLLLTSAHLIKFGDSDCEDICIDIGGKIYSSITLFCTEKNRSCEIAVLKIVLPSLNGQIFKAIKLSTRQLVNGEKLYAVGYSLFHTNEPNVSSGIVSKVSKHYFISNCLVHAGASGGAMLDASGCLVGIILGNIRNDAFILPNINISISCNSFGQSLQRFIENRDISPLIEWKRSVPVGGARLNFQTVTERKESLLTSKF